MRSTIRCFALNLSCALLATSTDHFLTVRSFLFVSSPQNPTPISHDRLATFGVTRRVGHEQCASCVDGMLGGAALLVVTVGSFAYWTVWLLLLPMWSSEDAPLLHGLFPAREWALVLPTLAFTTYIALLVAFVGLVFAGVVPEVVCDWQPDGERD